MNPLKVQWFHTSARVRLFHIWLVVQLGLHRKAPSRIRSKVVKIADWLEATVLTACDTDVNGQDAINVTYKNLQTNMAKVQNKEHHLKEEVDSIKGSFLQLLDLCGIKDADIPPLNEPVALRHSQQTLITSFGIMSKGLSGAEMSTPQHSRRHTRRDPASYADMLIEQLMANASPDSDTSPPSAEENCSRIFSADSDISSDQPSVQPMTLQFDNVSELPSSNLPRHPLSPMSDSRCEWVEDNLALPTGHSQHLQVRTSDSGITASGTSTTMSPLIAQGNVLDTAKSNQNVTSGSTPELPVSVSSESLDIPYASLFDNFDNYNTLSDINKPSSKTIPQTTAGCTLPGQSCYNFPLKYSHSYARELQRLETEMFSDPQLEPDFVPSPKTIPKKEGTNEPSQSLYLFQEPLVVVLPEKKLSKLKVRIDDKHDYNLNNNYKPCLEDKSGVVESDDDSPKPPIPPRVPLVNPNANTKLGQFVLASNSNKDVGNLWLSQDTPAETTSPCNMSWSYIDSPPVPCPSNSMVSMSTGKAHLRKKKGLPFFIRHPPSPTSTNHSATSASKRRRANDRSPMPVEHCNTVLQPVRSVRQRLFRSPARTSPKPGPASVGEYLGPSSPSTPSSTPMPLRMERMKKKKRHSPAMRRLMQEKENNLLSPSKTQTSPRKPLSELYNIQLNESDPLTTSSNSLTPSSEAYAKSSETSPDMPLPSRDEELRDRDAYYGDFTVDRDHKMDQLTPLQKKNLLRKGTLDNHYTLKDPSSDEILIRQVEGAECSPRKPVFQAPLPNTRAPRSYRSKRQSSNNINQQPCTRSSSSGGHSNSHSSSPTSIGLSKYSIRSRDSKRVSIQRRSSSSGSCSSHPMASSTFIMEPLLSPEKADTASVYTWSIEEGSETCNLERSFLRSQSAKKNNKQFNPNTPRPPTNIGCDSSDISEFEEMMDDRSSFEITAMVSAIDKSLNGTTVLSGQQLNSYCDDSQSPFTQYTDRKSSLPRTSTKSTISSRGIVTAAPNIVKKMPKSSGSSHCSGSSPSFPSSTNQPSSSSAEFNRAKGSYQSIPSPSDEKSDGTDAKQSISNPLKYISASAPDLARPCFDDEDDATHSLQPSDTDSTPDIASPSLHLEDRDIPGKSSSSGSSSCTAARCRPRVTGQAVWNETTKNSSEATPSLSIQRSHIDQAGAAAQDLLDSILTDSPKSIDSSGIFAPYNSYNSPAESVGSHNGYSSTVSSSVPSSDSCYPVRRGLQAPPCTPPSQKLFSSVPSSENSVFKKPFDPAPHVDHTARYPVTRSQGVTATASCATHTRPMSVRSDPLANKSIFAVPPGVVTGPPKIHNKKSLIKKLKKFSTNFYKKNEKIQTLANL